MTDKKVPALTLEERLAHIEWHEVVMEALRRSSNGNNPFYSDDPDTVSLAREIGDAVAAALAEALRRERR